MSALSQNIRRGRRQRKATRIYTDDDPSCYVEKINTESSTNQAVVDDSKNTKKVASSSEKPTPEPETVEIDTSGNGILLPHRLTYCPVIPAITQQKKEDVEDDEISAFLKRCPGINTKTDYSMLKPEWKEIDYTKILYEDDFNTVEIEEDVLPICVNGESDREITDQSPSKQLKKTNTIKDKNKKQTTPIERKNFDNKHDESENDVGENTAPQSLNESKPFRIKRKVKSQDNPELYVIRKCSCITISSCNKYMAIGDTSGYVTIYVTQPITQPIYRVSTFASKRAYEDFVDYRDSLRSNGLNEKIIHDKLLRYRAPSKIEEKLKKLNKHKPPQKLVSVEYVLRSPHAIESLAFSSFPNNEKDNFLLALSTKVEIEVHNMVNCSLLWRIETAEQWRSGPASQLSVHPSKGILASFSDLYPFPPEETDKQPADFSPLCLCRPNCEKMTGIIPQNSPDENVENTTSLNLGSCSIGVWDKTSHQGDYIFCLSLLQRESNSQKLELMKISSDTFTILHRITLSKPGLKTKIKSWLPSSITQSPCGNLLAVPTLKGIKLCKSDNLEILGVFGDGIVLHGHTLTFQECLFIQDEDYNDQQMVQKEDELYHKENVEKDWKKSYLVGLPHRFREPQQMIDILHFWKFSDQSKYFESNHPTFTLKSPDPEVGIKNLFWNHSKLILMSQKGKCLEMVSTMNTDWAGQMYPPGFLIKNDNTEYIEDEDEFDAVVDLEDFNNLPEVDDEEHEILEAVQKLDDESEEICVIDDDSESGDIPCHPEIYLQNEVYEDLIKDRIQLGSPSNTTSSSMNGQEKSPSDAFFSLMPPVPGLESARRKGCEVVKKVDKATTEVTQPSKSRRYGPSNVQNILRMSVNPLLKEKMYRNECWSLGAGSIFDLNNQQLTSDTDNKNKCAACLGRFTLHTCSFRDKPEIQEEIVPQYESEPTDKKRKSKTAHRSSKKSRLSDARRKEKEKEQRRKLKDREERKFKEQRKREEKAEEQRRKEEQRRIDRELKELQDNKKQEEKRIRDQQAKEKRERKRQEIEERKHQRLIAKEQRDREKAARKAAAEEKRLARKAAAEEKAKLKASKAASRKTKVPKPKKKSLGFNIGPSNFSHGYKSSSVSSSNNGLATLLSAINARDFEDEGNNMKGSIPSQRPYYHTNQLSGTQTPPSSSHYNTSYNGNNHSSAPGHHYAQRTHSAPYSTNSGNRYSVGRAENDVSNGTAQSNYTQSFAPSATPHHFSDNGNRTSYTSQQNCNRSNSSSLAHSNHESNQNVYNNSVRAQNPHQPSMKSNSNIQTTDNRVPDHQINTQHHQQKHHHEQHQFKNPHQYMQSQSQPSQYSSFPHGSFPAEQNHNLQTKPNNTNSFPTQSQTQQQQHNQQQVSAPRIGGRTALDSAYVLANMQNIFEHSPTGAPTETAPTTNQQQQRQHFSQHQVPKQQNSYHVQPDNSMTQRTVLQASHHTQPHAQGRNQSHSQMQARVNQANQNIVNKSNNRNLHSHNYLSLQQQQQQQQQTLHHHEHQQYQQTQSKESEQHRQKEQHQHKKFPGLIITNKVSSNMKINTKPVAVTQSQSQSQSRHQNHQYQTPLQHQQQQNQVQSQQKQQRQKQQFPGLVVTATPTTYTASNNKGGNMKITNNQRQHEQTNQLTQDQMQLQHRQPKPQIQQQQFPGLINTTPTVATTTTLAANRNLTNNTQHLVNANHAQQKQKQHEQQQQQNLSQQRQEFPGLVVTTPTSTSIVANNNKSSATVHYTQHQGQAHVRMDQKQQQQFPGLLITTPATMSTNNSSSFTTKNTVQPVKQLTNVQQPKDKLQQQPLHPLQHHHQQTQQNHVIPHPHPPQQQRKQDQQQTQQKFPGLLIDSSTSMVQKQIQHPPNNKK